VTIPQTRFIILMLMLLQIIATMQVFTEPFVITGGGPETRPSRALPDYKYAFPTRLRRALRAQRDAARPAQRLLRALSAADPFRRRDS